MCNYRFARVVMLLLLVVSLVGCSNSGNSPTLPQASGVLPTTHPASSGHSVTVKTLSAAELSNLWTSNGTPSGADSSNPDVGVSYRNSDGAPINEFYVSLPKAGDYMVEYKASGGWYALFFRTQGPVELVIGSLPGGILEAVEVYYDFTYLPDDAAQLDDKVGDVWFYANYGIWEDDQEVKGAVEYYAEEAASVMVFD